VTEAQLLAVVMRMCESRGLLHHHCRDSRYCGGYPGLPDLVISSRHGTIFAELKSATGDLAPQQNRWAWSLRASREQWHLWRPIDLADGTIQDALDYLAGDGEDPWHDCTDTSMEDAA